MNIKDGFWRLSCARGQQWNFGYVLPQPTTYGVTNTHCCPFGISHGMKIIYPVFQRGIGDGAGYHRQIGDGISEFLTITPTRTPHYTKSDIGTTYTALR